MKFKRYQLEKLSELLKSIRKEKNISINEISIKTKIQKEHIIDIEEGNYDKIPPGPYIELFIRDIFKELNVNYSEYLENTDKDDDVDSKKIENEPHPIEEKPTTEVGFGASKYLNYLFAVVVIALLFIAYKTLMPSVNVEESAYTAQETPQRDIHTPTPDTLKADSIVPPDSVKQTTVQEKELPQQVVQQGRAQVPRLAVTRAREWTDPPGPEITQSQLDARYNVGNLVEITAARGEVRLRYITRDDFWWKALEKGETANFRIDEAIVLEMLYPDNADMKYLGEVQKVGGARYIRYVIGMHTGVTVREVYQ